MTKKQFNIEVDLNNDIPKYQQLVDSINRAIANNTISEGDPLPSVNYICNTYKLSRDTVFKSYSILKEQGVIESVPNKGYYVANVIRKVLLALDTFKAYKEVLYHSFVNALPDNIITDVQFHHYNIENFKTILNNSKGKYYKYIVMPFDHEEVPSALYGIDSNKLLLIDWNIYSTSNNNYVFQDFGVAFYEALLEATNAFKKYKELNFLYPSFTNHPIETVNYFKKYCEEFKFEYKVLTNPKTFEVEKNTGYVCVSDRMLGVFLEQCKEKNLEPGVDVGFLSYNETPMKKFIYKGISVVSTDFKQLGLKAAEFVREDKAIQIYIPTKLTLRESL